MKKYVLSIAAAFAVISAPAAAQAIEGRWANPKRSVIVELDRCGASYCGTVVHASAKAKATARKGGTRNLIGTQILSGVRADGNRTYKGRAFDPKRNIRAPATIRLIGPDTLEVRGCAIAGLIC